MRALAVVIVGLALLGCSHQQLARPWVKPVLVASSIAATSLSITAVAAAERDRTEQLWGYGAAAPSAILSTWSAIAAGMVPSTEASWWERHWSKFVYTSTLVGAGFEWAAVGRAIDSHR